jgi:NADH-quinone oxidoreductase subunit L
VHESHRWGAEYAYFCVLAGVFVTALYTFRMIFLTFHGKSRLDHHAEKHFHDVGWDMKGPLVALAIPSLLIGFLAIGPVLFGGYFGDAIKVLEPNDVVGEIGREYQGPVGFAWHAFASAPVWLALAGVVTAWYLWLKRPELAVSLRERLSFPYRVLINKYYFDWFNENVIARAARGLGFGLWRGGDEGLIDGVVVNGSASLVDWVASVTRRVQTGYLYNYAFWMIVGLAAFVGWFLYGL